MSDHKDDVLRNNHTYNGKLFKAGSAIDKLPSGAMAGVIKLGIAMGKKAYKDMVANAKEAEKNNGMSKEDAVAKLTKAKK